MVISEDEEWIKAALSDDSAVAELLLLLHSSPAAPAPSSLRIDWSVRQRRSPSSKGVHRSPDPSVPEKGSAAKPTRASPTTPLSWSGATSSADGLEESSLPAAKPRSKELANLHVLIEKHRAMNERLKKLKLGFQEQRAINARDQCHPSALVPDTENPKNRETVFELPDLNLPLIPKEAFHSLSHKFHGKGPGKRKQEKRMKQYQEELKQMKNVDTPSLSAERMREAQAQKKTPYLALSGHVKHGQNSDPGSAFATVEKDTGSLTPMLGDRKALDFIKKRASLRKVADD
ncbi:hypothetical protein CDL15_Pgr007898 [Punica granatum]|uniref:Uncharacterized protein n=2 Tax=Punica granatum TaxID=22663 RepID=A0A218XAW8_PUNGR|nr:hypothetical protein CDL15_Pgr007898 [Punica granatum]